MSDQPITAAELDALRAAPSKLPLVFAGIDCTCDACGWTFHIENAAQETVAQIVFTPEWEQTKEEAERLGRFIVTACNLAPRLLAEVDTVRGNLRAVICDRDYVEGTVQRLTAEVERLRQQAQLTASDWAAAHTHAQAVAKRCGIDASGDSHGVPGIEDIIDMLGDEVERQRTALEQAKEVIANHCYHDGFCCECSGKTREHSSKWGVCSVGTTEVAINAALEGHQP